MIELRVLLSVILGLTAYVDAVAEPPDDKQRDVLDRIQLAVPLAGSVEDPIDGIEPTHAEYRTGAPPAELIRRSETVRIHLDNLFSGVRLDQLSRQFRSQKADKLVRVRIFAEETFYLRNTSVHKITNSATAWNGEVLDAQGQIIGDALFRIMEDQTVVGRIELPGRGSYKILPTGIGDAYRILDVKAPELVISGSDMHDRSTPEAQAEEEEWRRRMATPENRARLEALYKDTKERAAAARQAKEEAN